MKAPLKNKYFKKFEESRHRITTFCKLILEHLKTAQAERTLSPQSLGKAMLDFAQLPDITEENVLAEIELMFIAGNQEKHAKFS